MSKMMCHICKQYKEDDDFDFDWETSMYFPDCKDCYDIWLMQVDERELEELYERMKKHPVMRRD